MFGQDADVIAKKTSELKSSGRTDTRTILDDGWNYMSRGYRELAMMRFNEAWILSPNEAEVFEGFAAAVKDSGDLEEARKLFESALVLEPARSSTLCALARLHQDLGVSYSSGFRPDLKKSAAAFEKADQYYVQAVAAAKKDEDRAVAYYEWAVYKAVRGEFAAAWRNIHEARRNGADFIEPAFLRWLSRDMPEPAA